MLQVRINLSKKWRLSLNYAYVGYIGGSVLAGLLAHPNASTFDITVLVRSPEKAEKLKAFGVNPIVGSLKDTALLEDLTSKAQVVFACVCIKSF